MTLFYDVTVLGTFDSHSKFIEMVEALSYKLEGHKFDFQ
jgi:hypothetical protein